MNLKKGDFLWLAVLCGITALLLAPASHQAFINVTLKHPYLMGFIKFAILATMGELLVVRIVSGEWNKPLGIHYKAIVWGLFGMGIVLMFEVFLNGVIGAVKKGLLPTGEGVYNQVLVAFYISAIMNLTFAPAFMAVHRMTDTYIDLMEKGLQPNWITVIAKIDWQGFIEFVVFKTIPYFWIPAHTITFLLPPEFRVLAAAFLSMALGAILSYARRTKTSGITA
jgi:Mpv17 / PMP22 family.